MRIGLLSDIHSNLQALEAVVDDSTKRSIDKFYCLGDIVGYAANPKECLQIIQKVCEQVVFGNHEYAVMYPDHAKTFNSVARDGITHSLKMLDAEQIEWIKKLEPKLILPPITIAHGSLRDFEEYVTETTTARLSLEILTTPFLAVGHTHYPEAYVYDIETRSTKMLELFVEGKIALSDKKRYLLNAGSVGQPRDGDPRACYGILDLEELSYELIRVPYDLKGAANAIEAAKLPEFSGRRLYAGR